MLGYISLIYPKKRNRPEMNANELHSHLFSQSCKYLHYCVQIEYLSSNLLYLPFLFLGLQKGCLNVQAACFAH